MAAAELRWQIYPQRQVLIEYPARAASIGCAVVRSGQPAVHYHYRALT